LAVSDRCSASLSVTALKGRLSRGCSANVGGDDVGGVPVQTGVRDCNRGEASVVAAFYTRLGTLPVRVNTNRIAL
jgi:hypothetical protein